MNFSYRNQLVLSQILTLFLTSKGGDSVVEDDLRTEAERLLSAIESSVVEIDVICEEEEAKNNADDEDDDACDCDECCDDDVVEYDEDDDEPEEYESLFDDVLSLSHVLVKCIDTTISPNSPSDLRADKMYDIHFAFKDENLSLYVQREGFKKSGKCYKTIFVGYVDNLSMYADNKLSFSVSNDDGIGITEDTIVFQFDVENDLDNVKIWKSEFDVPVNAVITFVV